MAEIGIDLGTTNSVLAYLRGGAEVINIKGKAILPSAVMYDEGEWVVGMAAKNNQAARSDVVVTSPKRFMGTDHKYTIAGQTYTPIDMSAMILGEIKKHAEQFLGEPVTTAIITVPAHFNQQQVEDTRKAAAKAGLNVGKLLAEPVAASATYVDGAGGDEVILVFDLGGGTLDCTVVDTFDAKILGLSGDNWLGGDDFDFRIVDRLLRHLKEESGIDLTADPAVRLLLKAEAEKYKINLSESASTQVEIIRKLGGKICQIEFKLTRDEYERMIDDLVTRAIEKADEAIKRADMEKDDIDVVLLVGGSTLTPYVQRRLKEHFGKEPSKKVDPMLAVGLGAAISTRDLAWDGKTHRVMLRSRAQVWSAPKYTLRGRTTAGSNVEVTGGAAPVTTKANAEGQFTVEVALMANATNDLTIQATAPNGTAAKALHRIRHDAGAGQTVDKEVQRGPEATLPRNILLGLEADQVAVLIRAGTTLPTAAEIDDRFCCKPSPGPTLLQGPVFEGHDPDHEVPFGPLNTHMGTLQIQCPPTTEVTPLVVAYQVDESRKITLECWFKNNPSVRGKIELKGEAISRDKMHIVERTDLVVKSLGDRLRPDERTRINRKKQALIDLCEQYTGDPSEETRQRIIQTGTELQQELKSMELRYKL